MNDLMIDYFMAVARNQNFTKASEELFVSQPAISKQISQLEKELGAKLFNRSNQGTQLTEVGRLYFDFFSRYKNDLITTRAEADRVLGRTRGVIRVGFLEGWDLYNIIPPMKENFKAAYPDSEILINCCGVRDISSGLLNNSLDIAVTMKNSINMYREIECSDVTRIRKILIFSSKHPLADKAPDKLSLKDFRDDTFLAPWEMLNNMIMDALASYTRPYGFVPEVTFVNNHESMITCVRNNMGVSIIDEWGWAKDAPDLRWISLDAMDDITVARPKNNDSSITLTMERILTDTIQKL